MLRYLIGTTKSLPPSLDTSSNWAKVSTKTIGMNAILMADAIGVAFECFVAVGADEVAVRWSQRWS